jgi:hypothetical protein
LAVLGLALAAGAASAALTASPSAVSVPQGTSATVAITGARGSIRVTSGATAIATVSLDNVASGSATLTVSGIALGSTTVTVRDRRSRLRLPVTVTALAPMTVSPSSLNLLAGATGTLTASQVTGTVGATSSNTAVATVSVSGNVVTVRGLTAGSATVAVRDSRTTVNVAVGVTALPMTVSPSSLSLAPSSTGAINVSQALGPVSATSSNAAVASVSVSGSVVSVRAIVAGTTVVSVSDSRSTIGVPVAVTGGTALSGTYSLLAWNDLGMHCVDGKDYSVFSILPPYNNLHAQLVNASTGKAVTSGVTLSYEAVADPTGSINTTSAGKTNFWDWSGKLYGASPAADMGLTGNRTPSLTAKPLVLDTANGWFEASGLPITPYDDAGLKNYYPTVKVTARDTTGKLLASSVAVLPVSDEMTCSACHASRPASETNGARLWAKPAAGWVNASDTEKDWKLNILRLHDEKQAGNAKYASALSAMGLTAGMYVSALAGTPALCAGCHASNALPGTGVVGISTLTSALHAYHGKVIDPTTQQSLDSSTNRNACYMCHPGSVTKCLRGAMGNAVDASGNALMGCQNCHGNMTKVGDPTRVGWLQEPTCQACHFDGKRTTSAVDTSGNLVVPADTRFATSPNAPSAGFNLFRFSKGHGGMQCEACHGATHAEYPSSHLNDNLQSVALQGYEGTVRECKVCHANVPLTAKGGPHGMHTIGQTWVKEHHDYVESSGLPSCAYCHGSDYRGSPLSQVKVARSFSTEHGTRSFAAGQAVGCYDCHNGPRP